MQKTVHETTLGGVSLPYLLEFEENSVRFPPADPDIPPASVPPICVSEADWEFYCSEGISRNADMEFSILAGNFSDSLLRFGRALIHAAAIRWHEKAYLICGPSGVGKSTQVRFLQELRPGEFGVICGDRPILQFCPCEPVAAHNVRHETPASDVIIVHPSPWNGKENWHGAPAAPLAGIILLERGDDNRLLTLSEKNAALPMYPHMIQTSSDPEKIRGFAKQTENLLRSATIWKLISRQVPQSTKLLLDSVFFPSEQSPDVGKRKQVSHEV